MVWGVSKGHMKAKQSLSSTVHYATSQCALEGCLYPTEWSLPADIHRLVLSAERWIYYLRMCHYVAVGVYK
jgi:hypothetical protein